MKVFFRYCCLAVVIFMACLVAYPVCAQDPSSHADGHGLLPRNGSKTTLCQMRSDRCREPLVDRFLAQSRCSSRGVILNELNISIIRVGWVYVTRVSLYQRASSRALHAWTLR